MPSLPVRHILVDLENVPDTSLATLEGKGVEVTLLCGSNRKQLREDLTAELFAATSRAHVIQVAATGHNAVDIVLGYYLGRAAAIAPHSHFIVMSKDTDYDPLIKHAREAGLNVERCNSVESLPFLKKPGPPTQPAKSRAVARPSPNDRAAIIASILRAAPKNRPSTQKALQSFIQNHFKKDTLSDKALKIIISRLEADKVLSISDTCKVSYSLPGLP